MSSNYCIQILTRFQGGVGKQKYIPIKYNRRFTPDRIEHLNKNEVFVFGSNLAGQHGGGAARIAYGEFGAIWGQGVGMQGQSYAIPTMHGGVAEIKPYVDQFIEYAKQHPDLVFLVTRIGCGIAGFSDEQIAPLFKEAIDVENIILPHDFVVCLSFADFCDATSLVSEQQQLSKTVIVAIITITIAIAIGAYILFKIYCANNS